MVTTLTKYDRICVLTLNILELRSSIMKVKEEENPDISRSLASQELLGPKTAVSEPNIYYSRS